MKYKLRGVTVKRRLPASGFLDGVFFFVADFSYGVAGDGQIDFYDTVSGLTV